MNVLKLVLTGSFRIALVLTLFCVHPLTALPLYRLVLCGSLPDPCASVPFRNDAPSGRPGAPQAFVEADDVYGYDDGVLVNFSARLHPDAFGYFTDLRNHRGSVAGTLLPGEDEDGQPVIWKDGRYYEEAFEEVSGYRLLIEGLNNRDWAWGYNVGANSSWIGNGEEAYRVGGDLFDWFVVSVPYGDRADWYLSSDGTRVREFADNMNIRLFGRLRYQDRDIEGEFILQADPEGAVIPEPASGLLFGAGLLIRLAGYRQSKRHRRN